MNSKIIESITKHFSPKFRKKLERAESFKALIGKLEKKQTKLIRKLESRDMSDSEKALIEQKIKVLDAQIKKAKELLSEEDAKG